MLWRAGMNSRLLLTPALTWLALLFVAPLLMVLAASFATRGLPLEWVFSWEAWRSVLEPPVLKVLTRTLWFSLLTTAGALFLGAPLAWFIARRPVKSRRVLLALVLLPLIANSLVLAYAWMSLLARDGLAGRALLSLGILPQGEQILFTGTASLLGMIYYYLPFMVYPISMALEKMDWRLVEAAADLGAGGRQSLRFIVLPLRRFGGRGALRVGHLVPQLPLDGTGAVAVVHFQTVALLFQRLVGLYELLRHCHPKEAAPAIVHFFLHEIVRRGVPQVERNRRVEAGDFRPPHRGRLGGVVVNSFG